MHLNWGRGDEYMTSTAHCRWTASCVAGEGAEQKQYGEMPAQRHATSLGECAVGPNLTYVEEDGLDRAQILSHGGTAAAPVRFAV